MNKLITIFAMISVLFVVGCGDKVTNVTEYVNGYYSCVGIWTVDSTSDYNSVVLTFRNDNSWKVTMNYNSFNEVRIDSGYYVQNVQQI
jgi:hypothetical protein